MIEIANHFHSVDDKVLVCTDPDRPSGEDSWVGHYHGEILNGLAHGEGEWTHDSTGESYLGTWVANKFSGFGKFHSSIC